MKKIIYVILGISLLVLIFSHTFGINITDLKDKIFDSILCDVSNNKKTNSKTDGNIEFLNMEEKMEATNCDSDNLLSGNELIEAVLSGKQPIRVLITNNGKYEWTKEEIFEDENLKKYPGNIYINCIDDLYYVIDVLPLDEYLTYVLASEMPSSFEMEALKAGALCARTYALKQIENGKLNKYFADVDNTSTYQVFKIDNYNEKCKQAVEETKGEYISFGGKPIEAYYYACSGGVGASCEIWGSVCNYPYLQLKVFGDLEAECPWYRWSYSAPLLDTELLKNKILFKYTQDNSKVWVQDRYGNMMDENKQEEFLEGDYRVRDIIVKEYLNNITANLLEIICDEAIICVSSENAMRYILADSNYNVICQDGSKHQMDLLPSGYFRLQCNYSKNEKNESEVSGLSIIGGGFGHGVGMSQYGANYLAQKGYDYADILTFYYQNVSLSNVNMDCNKPKINQEN